MIVMEMRMKMLVADISQRCTTVLQLITIKFHMSLPLCTHYQQYRLGCYVLCFTVVTVFIIFIFKRSLTVSMCVCHYQVGLCPYHYCLSCV